MGNFCYRCMQPTVVNGVCTKCREAELSAGGNGENALPPGTVLGKGRITVGKKLGSGGFGVTYIAFDHKLNRRVALKEFMPNYLAVRQGKTIVPKPGQNEAYQKSMNSFMKEARTLYELRAHPNIVHVISVFKENNTAFYSMEMLEGESFLSYLKRKKKISANRAFQILLPVMKAIRYVHSKKMIHRDISPDNIMLCEDPARPGSVVPKLIDFGAAHVAIEGYSLSYPGVKKNGFSPLEQNWDGSTQGPWTDVYAFCATFYSAIVGTVPVSAQARSEEDKDPLKLPLDAGADIIPEMQDALMHGLKLHYQERTQDMDQLIQEMSRAVESSQNSTVMEVPRESAPIPARPVGRRISAWILEVLVLAAGVPLLRNSGILDDLNLSGSALFLALMAMLGIMLVIDLLLLLSAGSTLGQLFFGLKVSDEDGEGKPGFIHAFPYALFYASYGIPAGIILGLAWLSSGKNIGPLESLAGVTVGLRNEPSPGSPDRISGVLSQAVPSSPAGRPAESRPAPAPEPPKSDPFRSSPQPAPPVQAAMKPAEHRTPPGPVKQAAQTPAQVPVHPSGQGGIPHAAQPQVRKPSPSGAAPQPVKPVPSSVNARLVCMKASDTAASIQGKSIALRPGIRLGKKSQKADIIIPDNTVSGLHCSFHYVQGKGWAVKDEDSTNGTFINGVRLPQGGSSPLKNGTQITAGKEIFEFKC